ncbi:hypothetical protein FO489_22105, partial [Bacillus licheniformis]
MPAGGLPASLREVLLATARRRWSLTRYFAVVSVLAMLALGVALVWVTANVMSAQARRDGIA